jgi:hypothetical protein
MTTEGMPRGYTLHYDSQLGWWWSRMWDTGRCCMHRRNAVADAEIHHRLRVAGLPRIRGPICGAIWGCKGNGHITSGMTPEEAYSKWLAWQEARS